MPRKGKAARQRPKERSSPGAPNDALGLRSSRHAPTELPEDSTSSEAEVPAATADNPLLPSEAVSRPPGIYPPFSLNPHVSRKRSRYSPSQSPEEDPAPTASGLLWDEEYGITHPEGHGCNACKAYRQHIDEARRQRRADYLEASADRRTAMGSPDDQLLHHIEEANQNVRDAKREQRAVELENARLRADIQEARLKSRSLYLEPLASSYRGRGSRGRGSAQRYFDPPRHTSHAAAPQGPSTPTPTFGGSYHDEVPESDTEVDDLFAIADEATHPEYRQAVTRIKSIITAMPRASIRSARQRAFAARWVNPKTVRRQETRAAGVSAGIVPPSGPATPAYDAPLGTQLPFWKRHPRHLPLPLKPLGDDQRINERLAETLIVVRRFRPPAGIFHSDSQPRRSQWVNSVAQTFAHPTEDIFGLLQAMGVTIGPERNWHEDPEPRFPHDVDKSTPLDVLAFFAIAGLTPEWLGRLREFAIEYLAAHESQPDHPEGMVGLFHALNSSFPAVEVLPALDDPTPSHVPPPDIPMWSADDELDTGTQGGQEGSTS